MPKAHKEVILLCLIILFRCLFDIFALASAGLTCLLALHC
jgi:hypothetical protein